MFERLDRTTNWNRPAGRLARRTSLDRGPPATVSRRPPMSYGV